MNGVSRKVTLTCYYGKGKCATIQRNQEIFCLKKSKYIGQHHDDTRNPQKLGML